MLNFHPIELSADTPVELTFLKWIRPEIKFSSTDALREQIAKDVHQARRLFHLQSISEQSSTSG
jgi:riboflavin kinase/FMN adenylyltransferase